MCPLISSAESISARRLDRPRTLGALYGEYRSECWVALAVVVAVTLIALSQSRGEPRQVEPRAVSVGAHWQQ
jgi:hypothetical protein